MHDRQIDEVACHSDLRLYLNSVHNEGVRDGYLKLGVSLSAEVLPLCPSDVLGIEQVLLQDLKTART